MWRWVVVVLIGIVGITGCAAQTPPPLPAPTPAPGLSLSRDFPQGADREHMALRQPLGNHGRPGERLTTYYQFTDHAFNIGPGWCTTLPEKTVDNWRHMRWELTVDGMTVPLADYPITDSERVTGVCRLMLVVVTATTPGVHELVYTLTLDDTIGDGTYRYPPGKYINRIRLVGIPRQPGAPRPPAPRPTPLITPLPDRET